ncbi:unnamed protein product [Didymodactylos carnosus]|uniref:Uncharacterized protein n=2 Tax=Didymodactylos carnosus TaxID=1234261 RepID=A0A814ZB25_9BILA|nr:unnamed protein product [Didymodactylos carnosus]CAF4002861.1 unnamed protein product [Didymodactylos carnosus]
MNFRTPGSIAAIGCYFGSRLFVSGLKNRQRRKVENIISKRLSLKTLISSQNEKNEIIKENVLELRNKLESLQTFYYKLNDDQEILSQTMYKYIKDYEHNLDLQQQKNVSDEEQVSLTFTEYDNQDNSSLVTEMDKSHYEKEQNQQAGDASRDIILQKLIIPMNKSSIVSINNISNDLIETVRRKQRYILGKMFKKRQNISEQFKINR